MGKKLTDEQTYKAYSDLADCVIENHLIFQNKPDHRKIMIGGFRNCLFDSPSTDSGLVSEKGQHFKKSELVKEHFHPRQASAYKMFEMLDASASKKELVDFIKMVCQVHRVTKEENIALKPYQKLGSGYNTSEEQYAAVPINLVLYIPKKRGRKPKK